jgi:hypothetical protein
LADEAERLSGALIPGVGGMEEFADAAAESAEAAAEAEAAVREQTAAIEAQADAVVESLDSGIALNNAQRDAADQFAKTNEVIADQESSLQDIGASLDDAKSKALDAAGAQVQFAEDTATAEGRTLSHRDKINILRDSLLAQADTVEGPVRDALLELVARLDAIPPEVETEISTPGVVPSIRAAEGMKGAAEAIPTSRNTHVSTSGVDDATRTIGSYISQLLRIPSEKVTVLRTIPVVGGLFAKGGRVGREGGIGGEAGPEHIKLPSGQQAIINEPTALPPGTMVTPIDEKSNGGGAAFAVSAGASVGGGRSVVINNYFPPGVDPAAVVNAQRRHERRNGTLR